MPAVMSPKGGLPAARAAADLVVTGGRIEAIVDAVVEGRSLWVAVRDSVSLLIGGNMGEVLFTLAGGPAGGRAPAQPPQAARVERRPRTAPPPENPAHVLRGLPPPLAGVGAAGVCVDAQEVSMRRPHCRQYAASSAISPRSSRPLLVRHAGGASPPAGPSIRGTSPGPAASPRSGRVRRA